MKIFAFICSLILLLVITAESRGLLVGDTPTTLVHCKVYVDNSTRIQLFHSSVQLVSEENLNDTRVDTIVSYNASSGSTNFAGEFGTLEIDHNSVQLTLTPNSNKSIISVINGTKVDAQWERSDRLLIKPVHRVNHRISGGAEYEVRVRTVVGLKDKVIISLTVTGKIVEIDLNYEPEKRTTGIDICLVMAYTLIVFAIIIAFLATGPKHGKQEFFKDKKKIEKPRSSVLPQITRAN